MPLAVLGPTVILALGVEVGSRRGAAVRVVSELAATISIESSGSAAGSRDMLSADYCQSNVIATAGLRRVGADRRCVMPGYCVGASR